MKVIAMIPARLGSKRVKNKNLRLLGGKPLIAHVIETVKETNIFDEIYINSDGTITVSDDGRGIPVDIHKGE